ncbi:MAG: DUF4331 domain-containing protein [Deltaproteobacteria bacterium]|nr:DUF4331 domain-containing protein [Deltaproteobacteria bacterium]
MSAAVAALALLCPPPSYSADHREAPVVNGLPQGDLGDVFIFVDPNNANRLVVAMGVNGFAIPAVRGSYSFSSNFLYQFKFDNNGDFKEDLVIQGLFTGSGAGQTVRVLGPSAPKRTGATNRVLGGAPEVSGGVGQNLGDANATQVFFGLTDDAFNFDAGQFNRILGASQDLFRGVTSPVLGPLRGRPTRDDGTSGVDAFGGINASMLVVSFPKALVRGANATLNFWGTVSRPTDSEAKTPLNGRFVQFERTGLPAISTVFVPQARRDEFNNAIPEEDLAKFGSLIPDALTTTDTDSTGNTIAGRATLLTQLGVTALPGGAPLLLPDSFGNTDKDFLRKALLPDVLRFDMDRPSAALDIGVLGISNGRRPQDDVIDLELRLLRQLADVKFPDGSNVPGSGPRGNRVALDCSTLPSCPDRRVLVVLQGTDFIEADEDIADLSEGGNERDYPNPYVFPFFASAHPFPGSPGTTGFPEQQ